MGKLLSEEKIRMAMALFPGKSKKEVEAKLAGELKKKLKRALFISILLFVTAGCFVLAEKREQRTMTVIRPKIGATDLVQKVRIEGADGWLETDILVSSQELTEEQIEKLHEEAEKYLDIVIVGGNESLQGIETDLYFPEKVLDSFEVSWSSDALWLLDAKGQVHNDGLEGERAVTVTARIDYGTEFRVYERRMVVRPKVYTQEEQTLIEITSELEKLEKESRYQSEFLLPSVINGKRIKLSEKEGLSFGGFLVVLSVFLPMLVYHNYLSELEKEKNKRSEQAKNSYTEFVTKLSLMLVAGISVRNSFQRLAKEYAKSYGEEFVLTKELKVTCRELSNGCPEAVAYEAFGDRTGLLEYRRMATLLVQNATKGVQNVRWLLLHEAKEVMAEEQTKIKIRGEQAGTKLLLPMMGFLVLIFAVLLVPAFGMF